MMTPPPVSQDNYPVMVGEESRSNYLDGGFVFTASYVDNLLGIQNGKPIGDETYSFMPTISLDRQTPRQGESVDYTAGFNLYHNSSQLNGVNQDGIADYRLHLSKYAVLVLSDTILQNSNLYSQANPFVTGGGSTSAGSSNSVQIAPYANQLENWSTAAINYQYARNAMVGGSGSYAFSHYSNASKQAGLNNTGAAGFSAFYSRRMSSSQYFGLTYQFEKFVSHPIDTYTVSNTLFVFYTHYFTKSFSFSILAGPEQYTSWRPDVAKLAHWAPAVQGSVGWQKLRTNLTASYAYTVSGAPGLAGAYQSNMADLDGRLMFSRRWSAGVDAKYSYLNSIDAKSAQIAFTSGGRTISAGVDVQHTLTQRIAVVAGYQRIHEAYDIPAVSSFPDSNRAYFSLNYGFHRPLGR
ncbi:hypothetical protein P8935_13485 [Telmatobacter sp. DSM 110680]|uniref:Porin n=1 Tax=Telmatobacter sp. DSM 110680 TaxID=3036704 RepID=A0AAU7DE34_9BACT